MGGEWNIFHGHGLAIDGRSEHTFIFCAGRNLPHTVHDHDLLARGTPILNDHDLCEINDRNKTVGSICVPLVVPENTVFLRAAAKNPAQVF